jgi:hypothetical protein
MQTVEDMLVRRELPMAIMLRMDPIVQMSTGYSRRERGGVCYSSATPYPMYATYLLPRL